MKALEIVKQLETSGVPHVVIGGRLRVMDMTQVPGALRPSFDDRGFYVSSKTEAADAALEHAAEVQQGSDVTAKTANHEAEGAAFEAARTQTEAIREVLPMGETEREMTLVSLLNPSGSTAVPAHLETHEPKGPPIVAVKAAELEEADAPEKAKRLSGHLPEGFPGKAAFEAAGFDTYAKVRAVRKSGEKVENVGDKTNEAVDEIFAGEEA